MLGSGVLVAGRGVDLVGCRSAGQTLVLSWASTGETPAVARQTAVTGIGRRVVVRRAEAVAGHVVVGKPEICCLVVGISVDVLGAATAAFSVGD